MMRRAAEAHSFRLIAVSVSLLLTGCMGVVNPYPATWSELHKEDCAVVVGTYNNEGENKEGGRSPSLLGLLAHFSRGSKIALSQAWVTLGMPEAGIFEVHSSVGTLRFVASQGQFSCREDGIELSSRFEGGNLGPALGSYTMTLARDKEGWLVVRWEIRERGLVWLLIPVSTHSREWYRFRPV